MLGKKRKSQFEAVRSGDYVIRELTKKDWKQFKNLYLHALKDDPASFSESYSDKKGVGDNEWMEMLERAHDDARSIIAGVEHEPTNTLVGLLLVLGNTASKLSHVAKIAGFYLAPSHQSPDLEKAFLQAVLKHVQQFSDVNKMQVSVVTTDRDSLTLFNAFGFVRYGFDEKYLKVGRNYYDGILMSKTL